MSTDTAPRVDFGTTPASLIPGREEISGRILGSYIASATSLFFSFVTLWPILFTNRNAFGGLGEQFTPMWFWAVPAALAAVILPVGLRGARSSMIALILGSVSFITAVIVGGVLFSQLPV